MWRPSVQQMTTPIRVQHRVPAGGAPLDSNVPLDSGMYLGESTELNHFGAPVIVYEDADPAVDFCKWKGKGGTEHNEAGTLIVEDTAEITMWYRPDITEQTRLLKHDDPDLAFDVVNVEDVEERHVWLILKVRRSVNA